ncbi:MAG: immunoglobulin domain-containing protein [Verrucomicrobiaceae bacterium]|nr:immunoglobulin domain-containing protein [Verrucomicrobiaceae bacterium]
MPKTLSVLAAGWLLGALSIASAADYYVSTTGSDTAAGSLAAPWRNVQRAVTAARAGDTIHVRGGVYSERVTFNNRSGTSNARITLKSYNGEQAVLDQTGVVPPNGGSALVRINNSSYVTIQGLELRNYETSNAAKVPMGIYVSGASVGVKLLDNNVHHIWHNYAVLNSFDANAHGILVAGNNATAISGIEITGNKIHDLRLGASEALVLNGNVTDFKVIRNVVHDCNNIGIDFIGFEGTNNNESLDYARNGLCAENIVYNIDTQYNPAYGGDFIAGGDNDTRSAAGIYVDGGASIIIERNHVYSSNFGIEVGSEHGGRFATGVIVRNNLVRRNHVGGIFIGGYSRNVGGATGCSFTHNTLYQNDTAAYGGAQISLQHNISTTKIRHNIIVSQSAVPLFILQENTTSTFITNEIDWNLYSGSTAGNALFSWRNVNQNGFANWKTASGQDGHSFFVTSVGFSNVTALDFSLLATSAAVNAGDPSFAAATGEVDYFNRVRVFGAQVDIGMAEYGAPPAGGSDITTLAASGISHSTATLSGSVIPRLDTEVWFEYGASAALGQRTPSQNFPAGTTPVTFNATITNLLAKKKYYFKAVASDSGGRVSGTNRTFTTLPLPLPSITDPPDNQLAAVGESVTFTVAATGGEPHSFQWRLNGKNIAGATTASYVIPTLALTHGGSYTVKIANAEGSAVTSAAAVLAVFNPATVNSTANESSLLALNADVTAPSGALGFRWQKGPQALDDGGRISGATSSQLKIQTVVAGDAGDYQCVYTLPGVTARTGGIMRVAVRLKPVVQALVQNSPWIVSGVINDQIQALNSPTSFSATGLPSGVKLNTTTGVITGIASLPGIYSLRITAKNEAGTSAPFLAQVPVQALPGPSLGSFEGLVERTSSFEQNRQGGYLKLNISATGAATGTVRSGGKTGTINSRVKGTAGADTTFDLLLGGAAPLKGLVLAGSISNQTGRLTAKLRSADTNNSAEVDVEAVRSDWKSYRLAAKPLAAVYNVILRQPAGTLGNPDYPQGDGTARLNVLPSGSVQVTGVLPDGSAFSASSITSFFGQIPFFYEVPAVSSSALGWLSLNTPMGTWPPFGNQLNGTVSWLRLNPTTARSLTFLPPIPEYDFEVEGGFSSRN